MNPTQQTQNNQFLIYLLSFFSGFLSLSLEVVWVRMISFSVYSVPQAFSYTLAIFLVGISVGAWFGKQICKRRSVDTPLIGQFFLLAGILDLILIALAYPLMNLEIMPFAYIAAIFIFVSAAVRGVIFPTVHHLGTEKSKSGKQISNVYFANVAGSALSPVLIGFVVLDFLSTQQVYILICIASVAIAVVCQTRFFKTKTLLMTLTMLLMCFTLFIPEKIFHRLSEHVGMPLKTLVENKHGFIQVYDNQKEKDDEVYGANVYDGKFNTNLFHNTNGIDRAYWLPALQNGVKKVLVVGLSTGSWVRVLSAMPEVEEIIVIEINPDYVKLIQNYAQVAPILRDKRIQIVVDDGRKWLRKHPDTQFDMVLMNTTWHWRAYASNLLSRDFLSLVKPHLKNHGIFAYNSTGSREVFATALSVYPQVYKYKNFVYAMKQPLDILENQDINRVKGNLARLRWAETQQAVFADDEQLSQALAEMTKEDKFQLQTPEMHPNIEIITDDNMITEFKYGMGM